MYFFFQAEDGIRATSVTGVQTCALPIYDVLVDLVRDGNRVPLAAERGDRFQLLAREDFSRRIVRRVDRSEERRVGKGSKQRCKNEDEDKYKEAVKSQNEQKV